MSDDGTNKMIGDSPYCDGHSQLHISTDPISDGSEGMSCFNPRGNQGYTGHVGGIEIELPPLTFEEVYEIEYLASIPLWRREEYLAMCVPLFLEEIRQDFIDGCNKTYEGLRKIPIKVALGYIHK